MAALSLQAANLPYFSVLSDDPGAWPEILSSVGFRKQAAGISHVFVARAGAPESAEWPARIERGSILFLEGDPDMDPLRALPEFQQWLAEFKKKLRRQ